ncbi:MAG: hypothetical protein AAFP99_11580, partial [Pseudomonadota bacterium]
MADTANQEKQVILDIKDDTFAWILSYNRTSPVLCVVITCGVLCEKAICTRLALSSHTVDTL